MKAEALDSKATAAMTGITFTVCDSLAAASARALSTVRGAGRESRGR